MQVLLVAAATAVLAIAAPPAVMPSATTYPPPDHDRPNIVVLMVDDLAFLDHRVWERLPNIRSLFLEQGIEALNYWGNDPLCCPGRANFLTGQEAHVSGVVENDARLLDPTTTIATELHGAGYYTNVCGKYLNGAVNLSDRSPPGWDNVAIIEGAYYNYSGWINDVLEVHGALPSDYSTDVVARHCAAFLDAAPPDKPIFAWLTPFATHFSRPEDGPGERLEPLVAPRHLDDPRCADIAPWDPPNYDPAVMPDKPGYVQKMKPLPVELAGGYPLETRCRSLLSVDEWLGQVVAELIHQGRFENTIFVLTADNGMGYGAFRWERKRAPYAAQMSLFINWPAVTGARLTQLTNLITNVDLAPTLCELAGCVMGPFANGKPIDGQSFAGLIAPKLSSSIPTRRSIILEQIRGARVPTWRAIMTDPANHPLARQWLLIRYSSGFKELYDLSGGPCYAWRPGQPGDPCMMTNLQLARPYVRKKLTRQLAAAW